MSAELADATHVERTDDPTVLRWVLHRDDLTASPDGPRVPPPASPLGELVAEGRVVDVTLLGGDLLVQAADAAEWPELVAEMHDRVLAELDSGAAWLLEAPAGVVVELRARAESCDAPDVDAAPACAGCHVRSGCASADREGRGARRWSLRRAG
jgi:hypothetical protein